MKKSLLYVVVTGIMIILFYWFFNRNKVEYNGEIYEIRNDEFGIMLFDENAGDYSVVKAYKENDTIYIQLYKYQGRYYLWVRMNNRILYDIDVSNYDFSKFKKIPTSDLLK